MSKTLFTQIILFVGGFLLLQLMVSNHHLAIALSDIKVDQEQDIKTRCENIEEETVCSQDNYNQALVEDKDPLQKDDEIEIKAHIDSTIENNEDENNQHKEQITKCSGHVKCINTSHSVTIVREDK